MTRHRLTRVPAAVVATAVLVLVALGVGSAGAAPPCSITSVASGAWSSQATWNLGRVPNATDHVCIAAAHAVTHSTGTTSVLTVTSAGTLALTGGTLNLTDTSSSRRCTTLRSLAASSAGPAT